MDCTNKRREFHSRNLKIYLKFANGNGKEIFDDYTCPDKLGKLYIPLVQKIATINLKIGILHYSHHIQIT